MKRIIVILLAVYLITAIFTGCDESVAMEKEILQKDDYTEAGEKEVKHQKTATVYITNQPSTGQSSISRGDITASQRLSATYIAIIQSDRVMEQVRKQFSDAEFTVEVKAIEDTEIIQIIVESDREEDLAQICNAVVDSACQVLPEIVAGISCKVVNYAE